MTARAPRLLPVLAVFAFLAGAGPAFPDATWNDRESAVKKALRSEDPKDRARAFDPLRGSDDPRAVDLVLEGVKQVLAEQEKVRGVQAAAEKAYEQVLNDLEKNRRWFEASQKSGRDVEKYNAEDRRISKASDAALEKMRNLENDYARTRAQMDNAVQALGDVLARIPTDALAPALVRLDAEWLHSKRADDAMLWLDALAALERPLVGERIRDAARDATLPIGVRSAALVTLADRKDPVALDVLVPFLASRPEDFVLIAAAIQGLRSLHVEGAIDPLIDFLKREDVKRLRTDAQEALASLTGQTHGPYYDPWSQWWKEAKATFEMPPKAVLLPRGQEKGGVTFYGIHTFSDRILFVLDVSGSMDQAARPGPEGEASQPRIAVARKELAGAVNSLDDGGRFNVILFNHQVIPWQTKMIEANESTRRQAIRWAEAVPPVGGTNLHDALEAAFQAATRSTGRPDVDTVMFLTDGRPTAGKLLDPALILERVAEWNRTAHLTIHCVGIGEHDEDFLRKLAAIGHGEYVKR